MFRSIHEHHEQKRFEEAHAHWQSTLEEVDALIAICDGASPSDSGGIVLKRAERIVATIQSCALIEDRRGPGQWQGRSSGFSVPVATIGGHSVRYHVGGSKGHYVQGTPTPTAIDTGDFVITNQRLLFVGRKQTREHLFSKIVSLQHDDQAGECVISVSNRQKPTTIHYGAQVAWAVWMRISLAQALFADTGTAFRGQLVALRDQLVSTEPTLPLD